MGSNENHFNVSVGSDGQNHKTVSTNHNLFEEKVEPKRYRTEVLPLTSCYVMLLLCYEVALPLGQTGSHLFVVVVLFLFDCVGVLWPQLSKVLKLVRWAGSVPFPQCTSRGRLFVYCCGAAGDVRVFITGESL